LIIFAKSNPIVRKMAYIDIEIGGQRMAIEEKQAIELVKRYFNDIK